MVARQRAINQEVETALGDSEICSRCHASLRTWAEACTARLGDPCPGFDRIDEVRRPIVAKIYGFKDGT